MGKPAVRRRRSLRLIADFQDGYAAGWFYAVGDFFRDELDIKYLPRMENGRKVMRWTQGPYYAFKRGHTLYDTPKAYMPWPEALQYIRYMCQVSDAAPSTVDSNNQFVDGWVKFFLMQPNKEKTSMVHIGDYRLTQSAFVEYLKTGHMET